MIKIVSLSVHFMLQYICSVTSIITVAGNVTVILLVVGLNAFPLLIKYLSFYCFSKIITSLSLEQYNLKFQRKHFNNFAAQLYSFKLFPLNFSEKQWRKLDNSFAQIWLKMSTTLCVTNFHSTYQKVFK